VQGNQTLDRLWTEIHSLQGRRVTISALLHGWPARVTYIEFSVPRLSVPRLEAVVGPAVIEPRTTPGDIVRNIYEVDAQVPRTPAGRTGGGAGNGPDAGPLLGWNPTVQYAWEFRHVETPVVSNSDVTIKCELSGSIIFIFLHGSRRVAVQVRDPRQRNRRGQVQVNYEAVRRELGGFVQTLILQIEGGLSNEPDADPFAGYRASIRARFKLPSDTEISFFSGVRAAKPAFGGRFRWEPTLRNFPHLLDDLGIAATDEVADDIRLRADVEITIIPTLQGWRKIIQLMIQGARGGVSAARQAGRAGVDAFQYVRSLLVQWYGAAEATGLIEAAGVIGVVALAEIAYTAIWISGASEGERRGILMMYAQAFVHTLHGTHFEWHPRDQRYVDAASRDVDRLIQMNGTRSAAQRTVSARYGSSESTQVQNLFEELRTSGRHPAVLDRY
jgi:hypothetical protein